MFCIIDEWLIFHYFFQLMSAEVSLKISWKTNEKLVKHCFNIECSFMKAFKGFGPNVYPLGESRPPTNKFGDEWFLHGGQVTLFYFLDLKKPSSISLASFPMILIKIETVQWLLAHKNLILCLTWSILPCTLLPSWLDR